MELLLYIDWKVDPNLIESPFTIRWYGLLFAVAFLLGHKILERIFKNEGVPDHHLDRVLIYTMIGTIIGARLGHVFFYEWTYYSKNLMEIPQIWEGGLASHGGAIGIILALWAFSKWVSERSLLWILDRVAVPIALGGMFIRLGNLMNHEILGATSDLPWAFRFCNPLDFERAIELQRIPEGTGFSQWCAGHLPRHPVQLYEAFSYLAIFGILFFMYWKRKAYRKEGLLIGSFLVLIFTARLLIEFVKKAQADFMSGWPISMGQLLSIPFILIGIYLIFRARSKADRSEENRSERAEPQ